MSSFGRSKTLLWLKLLLCKLFRFRLVCNDKTACLLASYYVQGEHIKYNMNRSNRIDDANLDSKDSEEHP